MTYRDLTVWKKSMLLAKRVYNAQRSLPRYELFAMGDQLRRSAISIPSNIAEGNSRDSTNEYITFLRYAKGSVSELETQLLLCVEIGYFSEKNISDLLDLCDEVKRMGLKWCLT